MSGILIGNVIFNVLSGNTNVKNLVGDKIYPLYAPDETLTPFIVYNKNNVNTTYNKDGVIYDETSISISIISDTYSECITIASAVRTALELLAGNYGAVYVHSSYLTNVSDEFGIDGFVTTLEFAVKSK